MGSTRIALGAVFLLIAAGMSAALVAEHVGGLALPGCGEGGPCEQAANSVWGKVPVIHWPVSFLGLAYFLAALTGWVLTRGALPSALRWIVRLGAAGSAFFCVVILIEKTYCPYCVGAHLGNFALWITVELTRVRSQRLLPAFSAALLMFVAASVVTGVWDYQARAARQRKAEAARQESERRMIERLRQDQPAVEAGPTVVETPTDPSPPPSSAMTAGAISAGQAEAVEPPDPAAVADPLPPFTGRYRLGPEKAPLRIVMITDYQCRDCRRVEKEVMEIVGSRDDVSLSIKHFPFNPDCNPEVNRAQHPNACWAAKAAEAAGILKGDEGFFQMHRWLFERGGAFTRDKLARALREFGYEPRRFYQVMLSDEVAERIRADSHEAKELGLFFTPMIFINGVELRGWDAPNAVKRTIAAIAAQNPPARTAAADHPPPALEKCIQDWEENPLVRLPADTRAWSLGPAAAATEVVLWGDYTEVGTAQADGIIRDFMAGRDDVRYTFRHYPFDGTCNKNIPYDRHPLACWAARAAEAAGQLAGADGYWKVHVWLFENQRLPLETAAVQFDMDADELGRALFKMTADDRQKAAARLQLDADEVVAFLHQTADDALRLAAPGLGLDPDALFAAMERTEVQEAIVEDVAAAKKLPRLRYGVRPGLHAIPTIFIDGRYVTRWRLDDGPVLESILQHAVERK